MSELIKVVLPYVSPAALPLLICVALYFNFKVKQINSDRATTKTIRDEDSLKVHDELMKHSWELSRIKEDNSHRDQLLEDLRKQVEAVNSNLAVVATKLDHLVEAVNRGRNA